MSEGFINEHFPSVEIILITALQFNHTESGFFGEDGVVIKTLLGVTIKALEIGQRVRQVVIRSYRFLHIGNQHAKLGAPITHMVLPNDRVAATLKHPDDGIPDNRSA